MDILLTMAVILSTIVPNYRYQPALETTWHWQFMGTLNTSYDVNQYGVDLYDTDIITIDILHSEHRKVVCYFSAGTWEDWRDDADDFPPEALGDDYWEGERWLDIRHNGIKPVMEARFDLAKEKGCDGIEADNIDGYTNETGFPLTSQDQIAYNIFLADTAHKRGLSIALKNDIGQVAELVSYFDFAINESCHRFNECDLLMPFIQAGKAVFNAEYQNKYEDPDEFEALCRDALQRNFRTLFLPKALDDSFRNSCDDL